MGGGGPGGGNPLAGPLGRAGRVTTASAGQLGRTPWMPAGPAEPLRRTAWMPAGPAEPLRRTAWMPAGLLGRTGLEHRTPLWKAGLGPRTLLGRAGLGPGMLLGRAGLGPGTLLGRAGLGPGMLLGRAGVRRGAGTGLHVGSGAGGRRGAGVWRGAGTGLHVGSGAGGRRGAGVWWGAGTGLHVGSGAGGRWGAGVWRGARTGLHVGSGAGGHWGAGVRRGAATGGQTGTLTSRLGGDSGRPSSSVHSSSVHHSASSAESSSVSANPASDQASSGGSGGPPWSERFGSMWRRVPSAPATRSHPEHGWGCCSHSRFLLVPGLRSPSTSSRGSRSQKVTPLSSQWWTDFLKWLILLPCPSCLLPRKQLKFWWLMCFVSMDFPRMLFQTGGPSSSPDSGKNSASSSELPPASPLGITRNRTARHNV